jgi:tyrosinase
VNKCFWFGSFSHCFNSHGLPYQPWDGAGQKPVDTSPDAWQGYCTHGNVLFPTFHRPYVMLFEVSSSDSPLSGN